MSLPAIEQRLAEELDAKEVQIIAAISLLDDGATVPFIARYRKEVTGGLDDGQLRTLAERLVYLRELEERRVAVIKSIDEQGKMTETLKISLMNAETKTRLEDLYLPYKQKRRTKAQIAREAGLEPLANALFDDPTLDPENKAAEFLNVDKGIADVNAALDGARQILMERFAEDAELVGELRDYCWDNGVLQSKVLTGKEDGAAKFSDYFDKSEAIKKIPSHRALAMFRGRAEGFLNLTLLLPGDEEAVAQRVPTKGECMVARRFGIKNQDRPADRWLADAVRWTWRVKLSMHVDMELKKRLRESAELEAIKVFACNLKDLLLAAPAGPRATMGLDPGLRTGVKIAVVDNTGKLIDHATIYPHAPKNQWDQSIHTLSVLAAKHHVDLLSIGNGTASRETDKLAGELIKKYNELKLTKVMVSEAGASVYSASELAAREFPDVDVTIRGAVSIARRLQDPLAELVKIEPKAIGVGQYQHDLNQTKLARSLEAVIEDCVNAVGVDVNTASAALLTQIAGLNTTLAQNIVEYRDQHGAFSNRKTLLKVARLGPKAFEQAAGFLRVMNGDNPLDASAVHPEAYALVKQIAKINKRDIRDLMGDSCFLKNLNPKQFTDEKFGELTVRDILGELDKPGRDPRPKFTTANFQEGIEKISDLKDGMMLEGVVTNVTKFGAFIDVGVHQDGLLHISELADKFVSDPHEVVKAGDVVKVRVLDVDLKRKRVALTMKKQSDGSEKIKEERAAKISRDTKRSNNKVKQQANSKPQSAMAAAFLNLKQ
ncbi:Transcription accessory protein (S1 RNA-binding domain) [hydrothermal vent metagenome]|uniref:Transcription accessory protein (S1 RNA-binding domain) n=1 Tax=hydrothermal vent metagenome TaxID=652676 RepID=A0A3B1A4I9_9ZZZZ